MGGGAGRAGKRRVRVGWEQAAQHALLLLQAAPGAAQPAARFAPASMVPRSALSLPFRWQLAALPRPWPSGCPS